MEKTPASPEYRHWYRPQMHMILYGGISLWHCLAAPVLAAVLAESVLFGVEDIPVQALWLSYAASTVLVGCLVHPAPTGRHDVPPGSLLFRGVVTAGSFLFLVTIRSGVPADPLLLLVLALGVCILSLFLGSVTLCLSCILDNRERARRTVFAATMLAAAAPLWLAPLAEQVPAMTNAVVDISPLTYLAVISDYDFLRSAWFYRHTPLGGLRYDYPAPLLFTGTYLAMTTILLLAHRILLKHKSGHRAGNHKSLLSLEENTQ
ncbi:MAG: hypothetical protein BMS9Abin08_0300 [Gammaproteobacteria bacterium]|nr:MAG: hypothetical protein BMS9Abin08_0300 [Gammaproteobacteria bacterium]